MLLVSIAELNELLAAHEFTRRPGFQVTSIGDGECELSVPYSAEYERPGGVASGQLYMHAADVAFWLAIKTRLGLDDGSLTSGMTTAFLGSARREGFSCRARILRLGQRLIYGEAECSAGGRLLSHHTLTYARPATSLAAATTSS
jgi:acyl-coenzyme A thioesterase PaaI-like protein